MPLLSRTEYTPENLLADVALQRHAKNRLTLQLLTLAEGLERPINPLLRDQVRYTEYLVGDFETLPQIATLFYGTPDRWPDIAAANEIEYPHIVVPGMRLSIPN